MAHDTVAAAKSRGTDVVLIDTAGRLHNKAHLMEELSKVRRVIENIYFRPAEGCERVFIFTDSAFMREAANSLLKVLEEPPEFATIILLAENAGELLPTIRSRCHTHVSRRS